MAIGRSYPQDNKIVDADLFLGTKSSNLITVNYTAQSLSDYLNNQGKISIGGQMTFKFVIANPVTGTISLPLGGGDNASFSSITNLIVSVADLSSQNVVDFISYIVDSEILLTEQNKISTFGNYKITGYSITSNPLFYNLTLTYIGGFGNIYKNIYYDLNFFRSPDAVTVVPTLDQVLTSGNTSVIDAKIGALYPWDIANGEYGKIEIDNDNFIVTSLYSSRILFSADNSGLIKFSSGLNNPKFDFGGVGNITYTFPNLSGTVALTSDVGTWGTLNYPAWTTGTPFVKMTAIGTFALDTNTYLTGITSSDVTTALGYTPVTNARTLTINGLTYDLTADRSWTIPTNAGTVTSVGLSMPPAFTVSSSPITSAGTIAVAAAGTSAQYIRGDGQLATLPSGGGGGSSVNYYLNGSIAASVATYKQLSNTAIIGGGTDFTLTGNGLITQFLTDVGNPNRIEIPGGAWNFEMWFSMSSSGGTPKFYVELLKYNGTTFTTIANSSAVPETINGGTTIDLYLTSLAVPTTTLLSTDRLAIRVYIVNNSGGRTATLHTEDNHLCEILTTFSGGVTSLNGLTANTQYLAVGTTGTDFNISSLVETHTFNLPTASATNRGALTSIDWTAFNGKFTLPSLTSGSVLFSNGTTIAQDNANFFWDDTNNRLGIGTNAPTVGLETKGGFNLYTSLGNHYLTSTSVSATDATLKFTRGAENGWVRFQLGFFQIASDSVAGECRWNAPSGGFFSTFYSNGIERMRMTTTGNTLINTTTDNGGKLQIKAPGALSTDIALRVRNSADTADIIKTTGNGVTVTGYLGISADTVGAAVTLGGTNVLQVGNSVATNQFMVIDSLSGSKRGIKFGNQGTIRMALIQDGEKLQIGNFVSSFMPHVTFDYITANTGIGTTTPNATSILELASTTKGFLPPRMTNAQRIAIATPAVGLCVYCTDVVEGLYINKSTGWTYIG